MSVRPVARYVALFQGGYYLATGLWALVHMPSFLWVTGPKTDLWLVRTVAVLVVAIGLALLAAGRRAPSNEIAILAGVSAAGLLVIEVVYVLQGTIGAIYLGDAVLELMFGLGWLDAALGAKKSTREKRAAGNA